MSDIFEITSDLLGDSVPATEQEIADMVGELEYDGWELTAQRYDDVIRVYAERTTSETNTPNRYTNWIMITPDYGFITIAEIVKPEEA